MRKVLTFLTAGLVLTWVAPVMAQQAPDQFKDVEPNHWAYQAMESLRDKGIVIGYPDGYFRGRRTLTRYEFAVALDRLLSKLPLTPGPAGAQGAQGAQGEVGPAGEPGAPGKDYDPAELDALKKLTKEFKDELASMGNTANAINAKLDAITKDVAALKEAWDKAPKISGRMFFGVRADKAAGTYLDRNGSYQPTNEGFGTPLLRDPSVVHDFQVGIDAKLTGGATISAKLNASNYLGSLGGNFAQQNPSFGGNDSVGWYNDGYYGFDTKNAGEDVWLDQLEIKAPFSGIGRDGSLSIGRFNVQGSKYMLWKPDVDVYFDDPILDDGMYRADGLKLTTRLGSLDVELFGAQLKSVQSTDWEQSGLTSGINTPMAGMTYMNIDQMVGLSGKLPVRFMSGGYVRLAALGLSNNTQDTYYYPYEARGSYDYPSTVLVLGADSQIKVSDRLAINADWAKSITGFGNFQTAPGGEKKNNAVEGKLSYDAGNLKLAAGYKYIDPLFYTPGYWDRIGFWLNPTNVKGPTFCADYAFGENLGVKFSGEWLKNATASSDFTDVNRITAGLRYNLSKTALVTLDWEGDYARVLNGEAGPSHPTLQYVTIGTGYNLTSSTLLKVAYEIGDGNFNGNGGPFSGAGNNFNVLTTQVAVKF